MENLNQTQIKLVTSYFKAVHVTYTTAPLLLDVALERFGWDLSSVDVEELSDHINTMLED